MSLKRRIILGRTRQRKKFLQKLNDVPIFESAWQVKHFDPPSYPCLHEDSVSQDDNTMYCPDCNHVFKEQSQE